MTNSQKRKPERTRNRAEDRGNARHPKGRRLKAAPHRPPGMPRPCRSGLELALGLGALLQRIDGLGLGDGLRVGRRVRLGSVVVGHAFLEGLDALSDVAHHVGDLAAAEQQQDPGNHHDPVPDTHGTHKPPSAPTGGTPPPSVSLKTRRVSRQKQERPHVANAAGRIWLMGPNNADYGEISSRVPPTKAEHGTPRYSSTRSGGGARPRSRSPGSSGSSSSRSAGSSDGIGTEKPGGRRLSSRPEPFSSSRPGRSPRASRPKCDRKSSLVP